MLFGRSFRKRASGPEDEGAWRFGDGGLSRFRKQTELGLRWTTCGGRLFRRNARLLAVVGSGGALVIVALASIPFLGAPLTGLLLPVLVAAIFLALDASVGRTGRPVSAKAALQSLFADQDRSIQIVVVSLCSMAVALLAALLMAQLAGSAWWIRPELDPLAYARVAIAALLALALCSVAAGALIYALPLALLQQEPLLPAAKRSFKAAARHAGALAVLEGILLLPLALGAIVSFFGVGLGYLLAAVGAAVVLPLVVASLYCSYRTLFPSP